MRLRPTSCCGCFDLRTGSLVIAVELLVIGLFITVNVAFVYSTAHLWAREPPEHSVFIPLLVFAIITIILSCLLIHGIRNNIRCFVKIWLIGSGIGFLLLCILILVGFVQTVQLGNKTLIAWSSLSLGLSALCWYLWIIVFTYYKLPVSTRSAAAISAVATVDR